jgi:hypothetical protein
MSEKAIAIIPFTSLRQWVDEGGHKLDGNITYLIGTPYRYDVVEKYSDTTLPYLKFFSRHCTALDLHYSSVKFKVPFDSRTTLDIAMHNGIDDCQIQRLTLEFLDKKPPYLQSLVLSFTTKPVRATSSVGQYVIHKRIAFLDKFYGKEMDKIKLTQPRHLELIVAMKNGRNLNIQEQTNEVFLREIQKRTLSIVLIKSLIPYEITRFRDGHILNGVFYKGGEVKE